MAKVVLAAGFTGISGKIGDLVFTTRKSTGKCYVFRKTEKVRNKAVSEEARSRRLRFRRMAQEAARLMKEKRITRDEAWRIAKKTIH